MPETDDTTPVEYDMSFSTNARINFLLWQCNEAMRNEVPLEWFKCCKNLLKECYTKMIDTEFKDHEKDITEIEKQLNNYSEYVGIYNNRKRRSSFNPPRKVFDLLFKWELKLRSKLNKMKLLFKDADSAYDAMV